MRGVARGLTNEAVRAVSLERGPLSGRGIGGEAVARTARAEAANPANATNGCRVRRIRTVVWGPWDRLVLIAAADRGVASSCAQVLHRHEL